MTPRVRPSGREAVTVSSLQEPERAWDRYSPHDQASVGQVTWQVRSPRGRHQCGQAPKGVWGMSGRRQAMKGAEDCDKPGGAVKRALRPGSPNQRALNP